MARPARVAFLARKPCVRARLILLGWYVRFMMLFSLEPMQLRPGRLSGPEKFKAGDINRVSRPGQSPRVCLAKQAARKFVW